MGILKRPFTRYLRHLDRLLDSCTIKDAWIMLLLGVLMIAAGVLELSR